MKEEIITLDQVPMALNHLINKVETIEALVSNMSDKRSSTTYGNEWMNIRELCDYLPTHPARQTVYEWVKGRVIPFHKTSKKLTFNKTEIDEWLHGGYRKTMSEIEREADDFVNSKSDRL